MSGYNARPTNGKHYTTAVDRQKRAEEKQRLAAQAAHESLRYTMTPMTPMTPHTEYTMVPPSMPTTPSKTPGTSMTPPEVYHMMILPPSTPESEGHGYQVPYIWYPDPEGILRDPDGILQDSDPEGFHQEPGIIYP